MRLGRVDYPHDHHGLRNLVDPPLVHRGFFEAFKKIHHQVTESLKKVYTEKYSAHLPNVPLYFTGHSLGGAVASLMALETNVLFPINPIYVYNFGSPRVGNRSFAKLFNQKVPNW